MRKSIGLLIGAGVLLGSSAAHAKKAPDVPLTAVNGFEDYNLGDVNGQYVAGGIRPGSNAGDNNVFEDLTTGANPSAQIVVAPGAVNTTVNGKQHDKVLELTPTVQDPAFYSFAYLPLGDVVAAGNRQIQISFAQYRTTLNEEVDLLEDTVRARSNYIGLEQPPFSGTSFLYPGGIPGGTNPAIPLSAGKWQDVTINLDFDAGTLAANVTDEDGGGVGTSVTGAFNPATSRFHGIGFRVYGTNAGGANGSNYFDNLVINGTVGGAVPEPASLALLATGLAPLALRRRKK